jgi:hypothetical protein
MGAVAIVAAAIAATKQRIREQTRPDNAMERRDEDMMLRGVRRAAAHIADAFQAQGGIDPAAFLKACGYGAETLPEISAATRHGDPDTSRQAAKKANKATGAHALAVLSFARQQGEIPWTDEQLCAANADKSESSMRSRRATLVDMDYIERVGETINSRGNTVAVWRITEAGRMVR